MVQRYALVASLVLLAQACTEARFSPCKKDDNCSANAKYCVDLKCVECRSDENCNGGYCSFGVCKTLGGPSPHVTPPPSGTPSASPTAEPAAPAP